MLVRAESGRLELSEPKAQTRHLGLLMAPWPSTVMLQWYRLIEQACLQRDWSLQIVVYNHWCDTVISEAVRGMDGLFVLSIGGDFPSTLLDQWRKDPTGIVVLEQDVSGGGLPCLRCQNPAAIQQLIHHLRERGVRRVHCLNTQPDSSIIQERIAAWQFWTSAHNVKGELINEPVEPFESPVGASIELATSLIRDRLHEGDAILGITAEVTLGVVRAATNLGRLVGAALPVVSVDDWAGHAKALTPSITCLAPSDIDPLIQVCLDYMGGDRDWLGPLLLQPSAMDLFVGESTTARPGLPPGRA